MFNPSTRIRSEVLIAFLGLGYLAVLPISHTIALRNTLLAVLLIIALWTGWHERKIFKTWRVSRAPWPILLWAAYLIAFPELSADPAVAWASFWGQWGKGLMAMLAGATVAWWAAKSGFGSIHTLAIGASVPILLYACMFAWKTVSTGIIPWGYTGIEEHHGILGYASAQAALLLSVAWISGKGRNRTLTLLLMMMTISSMVTVRSRGGLVFSLLAVVLVFAVSLRNSSPERRRVIAVAALVLTLFAGAAALLAVRSDARWHGLSDRLSAGWLGDALTIHCEGYKSIEDEITERYGSGDSAKRVKDSIVDGDGIRVIMLRGAVSLLRDHPWGLDGSRSSFQKRLLEICAEPTGNMSHSHNGWLDTGLAIGLPGALLYLLVFFYFLRVGLRAIDRGTPDAYSWGVVLVSTSIFWVLRASVDSCFRDHMLQMQGFLLAYAAAAVYSLHTKERFADESM